MAVNKLLTIEYKFKITSKTYGNLLKNAVVWVECMVDLKWTAQMTNKNMPQIIWNCKNNLSKWV